MLNMACKIWIPLYFMTRISIKMPAVTVNLNVNIEASGAVNIFSQPFAGITNELVADLRLPASDLYKGTAAGASLLEFSGVTNAEAPLDDIVGAYNAAFKANAAYQAALASSIHSVVTGSLTASAGSIPFGAYGTEYRGYNSFGELALAAYAHYIFGHVDATAAIDNDTVFKGKMNGTGAADAKLGEKLAAEVFTNLDPTAVVKQVLGQDATRTIGQDNDGPTGSASGIQNLIFKADDVIYMAITLKQPSLTIANGGLPAGLFPAGQLPGAAVKYNIKITLA